MPSAQRNKSIKWKKKKNILSQVHEETDMKMSACNGSGGETKPKKVNNFIDYFCLIKITIKIKYSERITRTSSRNTKPRKNKQTFIGLQVPCIFRIKNIQYPMCMRNCVYVYVLTDSKLNLRRASPQVYCSAQWLTKRKIWMTLRNSYSWNRSQQKWTLEMRMCDAARCVLCIYWVVSMNDRYIGACMDIPWRYGMWNNRNRQKCKQIVCTCFRSSVPGLPHSADGRINDVE